MLAGALFVVKLFAMFRRIILKFRRKHDEAGGVKNLLLHTSLALMLTSGMSYFFGLLRDKIFAYRFGAGSVLDVYNASFTIPDLFLAVFVTGAILAAFVPIFTELDEKSLKKSNVYMNQILSYGVGVLVVASVLFAISLPWIVDFLVPGFDAEQKAQYILLTRMMLISPILFTISNTFGAVLISIRGFLWYGLAPVFYNIGIIFGVLVLVPNFGIAGLVCGTLIGVFLHILVRLIPTYKYGLRFRMNFSIDENLKETFRLMLPKMAQLAAWQLLLIWFVRLASDLPEGSVTIYSFSRNFQSVPVSLIGIAIALAAFSKLSHLAADGEMAEFKKVTTTKGFRIVVATGVSAIGLAIAAPYIIRLLLGGGAFDDTAVALTASMLMIYCISIPLESLMHLLARAHYALKNTLRPSLIHITSILVIVGSSQLLVAEIGVYAIPASFSIGLAVQVGLLVASLRGLISSKPKLFSRRD
ncbi:murein biosynthesis integral membrane protein MurJ [Candidatus Peregrinibacteria bacterium CG2_30_44_17]|nr:MAG: murein biosynthesis integral membrane protein MurJ [Candidatus Peregrinibacteria bacterium CG2_30_44_17]